MTDTPLADVFHDYFRFAIGDLVISRPLAAVAELDFRINKLRTFERVTVPTGMTIVQRRLEQCHGGIQGFYTVRRWTLDQTTEVMVSFAEHEVVAWSELSDAAGAAVGRSTSAVERSKEKE